MEWVKHLAGFADPCGWIAAAAISIAIAILLTRSRARAIAAVVFAALLVVSLRPGFAATATLTIVVCVTLVSRLKYKYTGMTLHAYDLAYFLRNRVDLVFFVRTYKGLAAGIIATAMFALALLAAIMWAERSGLSFVAAVGVFGLALLAGAMARGKAKRNVAEFFDPRRHFISFVDSLLESIRAVRHGGVFVAERTEQDASPFAAAPPSAAASSRPTVIVILNESAFPPDLYEPRAVDPDIAAFFRSSDGRERGLRVEAFGGGTWKTEFSVLTGIPVSSYGPFADHVFHWSAGNIHHSLPQTFKALGYRTAFFAVLLKQFVGTGEFAHSIGFDSVHDHASYGTKRGRERDRFYFDYVLNWLETERDDKNGGDFLYVETVWNHGPHHLFFKDENGALTEHKNFDGEFDEYMRRLRLTCEDHAWLRGELARRFPDRPFVIARFGDHQPPFAAQAPGRGLTNPDNNYRTYFAIEGVNFEPVIDPTLPETIEPAYLGEIVLEAAGLPLDSVHLARRELMIRHGGKFFFAEPRGEIAAGFNRRLIDAGLVTPH